MKKLLLAAAAAMMIFLTPAAAAPLDLLGPLSPVGSTVKASTKGKSCAVSRGIFGNVLAPMNEYITPLKKRCGTVVVKEWYQLWPGAVDEAWGHSAGADDVLRSSGAKKVVAIDPTFLNPGCRRGAKCDNYYGAINKFPLLVCCGGYQARGARNIEIGGTPSFIFAPGHLQAPQRALKRGALN